MILAGIPLHGVELLWVSILYSMFQLQFSATRNHHEEEIMQNAVQEYEHL